MGVGGKFWDMLKPYSRSEGFDFLRNKRVAVDLSYWIVQNQTAIKGFTRNPHLRLAFFRTINLFSKFGAFPIFVVDGTPSHLKSQTRMLRFFRGSGIDVSSFPVTEEGVSVERNGAFQKRVQECVELLELLGVPVLKASGEAEALCAQLNRDGLVDACITADSDAFVYGAKCVIKHLSPNSKDPIECYNISDIEAGLGLKRNHLIAVALLVGNDFDLNGVPGIGLDTAVRFVKDFSEDVILNRLQEIGRGDINAFQENEVERDLLRTSEEIYEKSKTPHCSFCGHPGSKNAHHKSACNYCCCDTGEGCIQKPPGFKCSCSACGVDRKRKLQKSSRDWQIKVCKKIHLEENFPNEKIIEMYTSDNQYIDESQLSWADPRTDMLTDFLAYSQNWEPSYTRQMMLPLLSTIYLRDIASNRNNDLLCGQYEFHSIQRLKTRFGYQRYVVRWKKATPMTTNCVLSSPRTPNAQQELGEAEESADDSIDEPDVPQVYFENGCWFLLTDEDIELVRNAFPDKVDEFYKEKALKEEKSKKKKPNSELRSPLGVQLSIKEFYRSSKAASRVNLQENADEGSPKNKDSLPPEGKRKEKSCNYSKSVRRKLLFG